MYTLYITKTVMLNHVAFSVSRLSKYIKDWCSKTNRGHSACENVFTSLLLALSIVKGLIAVIGYILSWIRNCSVDETLNLISELEV